MPRTCFIADIWGNAREYGGTRQSAVELSGSTEEQRHDPAHPRGSSSRSGDWDPTVVITSAPPRDPDDDDDDLENNDLEDEENEDLPDEPPIVREPDEDEP